MIRKLRVKFIVMAMVAVFILLGIVVAGMNLVNYRAVVDDASETLAVLSRNKGAVPDLDRMDDLPPWAITDEDRTTESAAFRGLRKMQKCFLKPAISRSCLMRKGTLRKQTPGISIW